MALRTDWYKRTENFDNIDENGIAHYPGWTIEACEYLIKERKVKAIGHEASDTDAYFDFCTCRGVACGNLRLSTRYLQVELMRNLDKLPPMGAVILVISQCCRCPWIYARCYGFVKNKFRSDKSRC